MQRQKMLVAVIVIMVAAVAGSVIAQPIPVDCDAGDSLAAAVATASPGMAIAVLGTCQEEVTITTDQLTLDGGGTAIIDGGGGGSPGNVIAGTLTVDGARDVLLTGLTVQNGMDGIVISRGASVVIRDVTSQNHSDDGIQATDTATASLEGTILSQNNGDDGILVAFASSLSIAGQSTVEVLNNGDDGIAAFSSSSLRITTATVRANNNGTTDTFGDGIQVTNTSTAWVASSATLIAEQNASRGLLLSNVSTVSISAPSTTTLSNNGRDGLGVFNLSRFALSGTSELRSASNTEAGIRAATISIATCSADSTVILDGNGVPVIVSDSLLSPACRGSSLTSQDTVTHGEEEGY